MYSYIYIYIILVIRLHRDLAHVHVARSPPRLSLEP